MFLSVLGDDWFNRMEYVLVGLDETPGLTFISLWTAALTYACRDKLSLFLQQDSTATFKRRLVFIRAD